MRGLPHRKTRELPISCCKGLSAATLSLNLAPIIVTINTTSVARTLTPPSCNAAARTTTAAPSCPDPLPLPIVSRSAIVGVPPCCPVVLSNMQAQPPQFPRRIEAVECRTTPQPSCHQSIPRPSAWSKTRKEAEGAASGRLVGASRVGGRPAIDQTCVARSFVLFHQITFGISGQLTSFDVHRSSWKGRRGVPPRGGRHGLF